MSNDVREVLCPFPQDRLDQSIWHFQSHQIIHREYPNEPILFALHSIGGAKYDLIAKHFMDFIKRLDKKRFGMIIDAVNAVDVGGIVIKVSPSPIDDNIVEFDLELGTIFKYSGSFHKDQNNTRMYRETIYRFIEYLEQQLNEQ